MELFDEQVGENTRQEEKREEKSTTSDSKFKDHESLLKAYNSLEAEFTKRCQHLKKLEGELLSLREKETSAKDREKSSEDQSEKKETVTPLTAYERSPEEIEEQKDGNGEKEHRGLTLNQNQTTPSKKDEREKGVEKTALEVFEFLQKYPNATKVLEEIVDSVTSAKENTEKSFERDYVEILENQAQAFKSSLDDEEYLLTLVREKALTDKIIKEYLSLVKENRSGAVLLGGGGTIPLTPPLRPKSFEEAGALAKGLIKIK